MADLNSCVGVGCKNQACMRDVCDLVVVGTKGLTGGKRLRLGSVADYLAHHVQCSILIVRDTYPPR